MIYIYSNNNGSVRQFMPFIDCMNKMKIKHRHIIKDTDDKLFNNKSLKCLKNEISDLNEPIYFMVGNYVEFIELKLSNIIKRNKHRIIYRARGIIAEESFLKNKSKIKYLVLSLIEKYVLKNSNVILTVSENQSKHYKYKYNIDTDKMYIIHNYISYTEDNKTCCCEEFFKEVVYVGGASKWQQIDKIHVLFENINRKESDIKFLICTNEEDVSIFREKFKHIKNLEIKSLKYEELIQRISRSSVGIILRDTNIVNRVSSPFKIIDYFNANIPIIITDSIGDYNEILKDKDFIKILEANRIDNILTYTDEVITFINKSYKNRKKLYNEIDEFKRKNLSIDNEFEKFIKNLG